MSSGLVSTGPEDRFAVALAAVAAELTARPDIDGLLFFGSAARGEARAGSDVDLYAVTAADAGGHLGRVVGGVPVEVSFASAGQMRGRVRREEPVAVHAFATGRVLFDRTGDVAALCREAAAVWARGPAPLAPEAVLRWRFRLTDLARDLEDAPPASASTALLAATAVRLAVEGWCAAERRWPPPTHRAVETLRADAPAFAAHVETCFRAGFAPASAVGLLDAVLAYWGGRLAAYDTTTPAAAPPGPAPLSTATPAADVADAPSPAHVRAAVSEAAVHLRPLGPADVTAYLALRREALAAAPLAFGESVAEHDARTVNDEVARLAADDADTYVLGAFVGGRLLGMAGITRGPRRKSWHRAAIWGVYVADDLRGRGVGRRLVEELLRRAKARPGLEAVWLTVTSTQVAARATYDALGFAPFGLAARALRVGDQYVDEAYLERRL